LRIARTETRRASPAASPPTRNQLRVELGLLDLLDVDEDLAARALLDLLLELVDLRALAPMMMPAATCGMSIFNLFAARSISIFETPACLNRAFRLSRSDRSSCSSFA